MLFIFGIFVDLFPQVIFMGLVTYGPALVLSQGESSFVFKYLLAYFIIENTVVT